ncbi:MAG: hypothetical protein KDC49_12245 [Saprospiraceae bacterium]|nr:hypothetical protein [Saprospiraceae bacterium]
MEQKIKYHQQKSNRRRPGLLMSLAVVFMTIFTLYGCVEEEANHIAEVDADLRPFFERFSEEAQLRGRAINVMDSNIIATLTTSLPLNIIGQCQRNSALPNEVKISKATFLSYSYIEKEYLIFHELGHCILRRSHIDDKDLSGNCKSIMESGLGTCRRIYANGNRTNYLDELFSQ